MGESKIFGPQDFPEHRRNLLEQAENPGMEACVTHQQRADYIRRLVRGIFASDLPDLSIIGETRLVFGTGAGIPIPELERVRSTWLEFPAREIAEIIQQERARAEKDRANGHL